MVRNPFHTEPAYRPGSASSRVGAYWALDQPRPPVSGWMPTCLRTSPVPRSPRPGRGAGAAGRRPWRDRALPGLALAVSAALRPAGYTHARQPRAASPSRRICQRALYSCRQLPSVMFSNTTPRPLLCEQAGLGHYAAKTTVLKHSRLQAGFLSPSFLPPPPGCSQRGAPPEPTGRCSQGTDTELLPSLRGFTGEKNL